MITKEKLVNLHSIGIIVMKQGRSPTPTDILVAYNTVMSNCLFAVFMICAYHFKRKNNYHTYFLPYAYLLISENLVSHCASYSLIFSPLQHVING